MLVAAVFGLAIGAAVGMLGGGGSVLAVPVLVYVLGENIAEATTASLLVVSAGAFAGALRHARANRVCWRHAGSFTLAALPGIVAGTAAGSAVGGDVVLVVFAVVMLVAARATWRRAGRADPARDEGWVPGAQCPPLRMPRDLFAGVAVGFLTGFLGVGGGFLIVPTLAVALAFSMRTAVGTSLAIITATSVLGLGVHLLAGRTVDAPTAVAMAAACAAGALAGAALSERVSQRTLGRGFAVMVALVAGYVLATVA